MIKKAREHSDKSYLITIDLFYPAVLGTIMYSLIDGFESRDSINYTLLITLLLVAIYVIDFVYVKNENVKNEYNVLNGIIDTTYIGLIAVANHSVINFSTSNDTKYLKTLVICLIINRFFGILSELSRKIWIKKEMFNFSVLTSIYFLMYFALVIIHNLQILLTGLVIVLLFDIIFIIYRRLH